MVNRTTGVSDKPTPPFLETKSNSPIGQVVQTALGQPPIPPLELNPERVVQMGVPPNSELVKLIKSAGFQFDEAQMECLQELSRFFLFKDRSLAEIVGSSLLRNIRYVLSKIDHMELEDRKKSVFKNLFSEDLATKKNFGNIDEIIVLEKKHGKSSASTEIVKKLLHSYSQFKRTADLLLENNPPDDLKVHLREIIVKSSILQSMIFRDNKDALELFWVRLFDFDELNQKKPTERKIEDPVPGSIPLEDFVNQNREIICTLPEEEFVEHLYYLLEWNIPGFQQKYYRSHLPEVEKHRSLVCNPLITLRDSLSPSHPDLEKAKNLLADSINLFEKKIKELRTENFRILTGLSQRYSGLELDMSIDLYSKALILLMHIQSGFDGYFGDLIFGAILSKFDDTVDQFIQTVNMFETNTNKSELEDDFHQLWQTIFLNQNKKNLSELETVRTNNRFKAQYGPIVCFCKKVQFHFELGAFKRGMKNLYEKYSKKYSKSQDESLFKSFQKQCLLLGNILVLKETIDKLAIGEPLDFEEFLENLKQNKYSFFLDCFDLRVEIEDKKEQEPVLPSPPVPQQPIAPKKQIMALKIPEPPKEKPLPEWPSSSTISRDKALKLIKEYFGTIFDKKGGKHPKVVLPSGHSAPLPGHTTVTTATAKSAFNILIGKKK